MKSLLIAYFSSNENYISLGILLTTAFFKASLLIGSSESMKSVNYILPCFLMSKY